MAIDNRDHGKNRDHQDHPNRDNPTKGKVQGQPAAKPAPADVSVAAKPHPQPKDTHVVLNGGQIADQDLTGRQIINVGGEILRCITGGTPDGTICVVMHGNNPRFRYSTMQNVAGRGLTVDSGVKALIEWSLFKDWRGQRKNVHEVVQLGTSLGTDMVSLFATLRCCIISNATVDSEAVSVKSRDNLLERVVLVNCPGSHLMFRHGRRNTAIGCVGLIRVMGADDVISYHTGNVELARGDLTQAEFEKGVHGWPVAENLRYRNIAGKVLTVSHGTVHLDPIKCREDMTLPEIATMPPLPTFATVGPMGYHG